MQKENTRADEPAAEHALPDDPRARAGRLAERLAEHGHDEHAKTIEGALGAETEHAALVGLRELCQTLLTWVEAFDPVTIGMAEELRIAVDHELGTVGTTPAGARGDDSPTG